MKNKRKALPTKEAWASMVITGTYASDSDMLNFLDQQGSINRYWKVQLPSDYPHVKECVFVCRNSSIGHKTIREAIAERMAK